MITAVDKTEFIARVAHEVNRAYCHAIGDKSQPRWEEAPQWQRDSAVNGVKAHMDNPDATPEQSDWERAVQWAENALASPLMETEVEAIAALLAEVRAEERERCAQVCEGMSQAFTPCADAIRGLK